MGVSINLTAITWAHAVNSVSLLTIALNGKPQHRKECQIKNYYYLFSHSIVVRSVVVLGNVRMIEADILLGTLESDDTVILPIMAHPPHTTSDLSLETFLRCILAHNDEHTNNVKGVKLDFKSIESFDGSLNLLKSLWHLVIYLFVLLIC